MRTMSVASSVVSSSFDASEPKIKAAVAEYEDSLGRAFRNLQRSLHDANDTRDLPPSELQRSFGADASVRSYEEGLGRRFRDLQEWLSKDNAAPLSPATASDP